MEASGTYFLGSAPKPRRLSLTQILISQSHPSVCNLLGVLPFVDAVDRSAVGEELRVSLQLGVSVEQERGGEGEHPASDGMSAMESLDGDDEGSLIGFYGGASILSKLAVAMAMCDTLLGRTLVLDSANKVSVNHVLESSKLSLSGVCKVCAI
ncbi:hypothetical protein ACFX15_036347 [Malus domestica]